MTLNVEFQELQDRLQTYSESVPAILRRSKLTDELAADIERMRSATASYVERRSLFKESLVRIA